MDRELALRRWDRYLGHLRAVPFVRQVHIKKTDEPSVDAYIRIRTPKGTFRLAVEEKRTLLGHTLVEAAIAQHRLLARRNTPLLLLTLYVPRPTGERLAAAGVSFADEAGNLGLQLGPNYQVLLLGRGRPSTEPLRRPTPGFVQLVFVLLAIPEAVNWPVRKLAATAGIGKTMAALGRKQLLAKGIYRLDRRKQVHLVDPARLEQEFLEGYERTLRRHLLFGTFRPQEKDPQALARMMGSLAARTGFRWAATGGVAAFLLTRYYKGNKASFYLQHPAPAVLRELKLLPDTAGPVTLLELFGTEVAWKTVDGAIVAHPWLVLAELLYSGDERAREAAEHLRERYLQP